MTCDLERFKEGALTRRELAWQALKETRNPQYVALRYDYPLETMQAALAKLPDEPTLREKLAAKDSQRKHQHARKVADYLPEPTRAREPGEDDDIGEDA